MVNQEEINKILHDIQPEVNIAMKEYFSKVLSCFLIGFIIIGFGYITYRDFYLPITSTITVTAFIIGVEPQGEGVRISYGIGGDLGARSFENYYPFQLGHVYNITATRWHIDKVVELKTS